MDKESTPLLSNPKGAGRLLINQPQQIINAGLGEGPTRRRNGQHHQSSSSSSSSTSPLPSLSQSINSNHHKNDIHIGSNNNNNGSKTTKLYNNNSNNNSNNNNNNNVNNRTIFQQISASAHVLRQAIRPITRGNGGGRSSNNKSNNNNNKSTRNDIIRSFSVDSGSNSHAIYYEDNYNDLPWKCSFGTGDNDGIWMNTTDKPGIIMSCMVWIMILYSGLTVTILAKNNALHSIVASIYCTLCALALSAHAKTTFTDPGVIPKTAVPTEEDGLCRSEFPMCSVCETYKPKHCHHCRICNRCVSGMDHHCPWMNNCIGRGNMKHFFLFLVYVWLASAYALSLFTLNYFLCNNNDECTFPDVLVTLVRIMTLLCMGAICFTSSMIMNVLWGMMTGLGTIDRMKREESQNYDIADEPPIHWKDVFGIQHYVTWFFPIDPVFEDYDRIMGYSTIPRLQREKKLDSCNNLV